MGESTNVGALTTYRFFTVNEVGDVTSLRWIQCADDGDAQQEADALFSTEAIEIWDVERQVAYIDKGGGVLKPTH